MRTNESAFTPQRKQSFGGLIILIMFLAFVAWLFLRACTNTAPLLPSTRKPTAVATEQPAAQPVAPVATPEMAAHQVCFKGACIRVPTCGEIGHLPGMALNDGCADMTPGNQGGYGLGDVTDKIPAAIDLNPPSVDGWWLARMNFIERENTCVYNAKSTRLSECQRMSGEWLTYLSQRRYVSAAIKKMMEDQ